MAQEKSQRHFNLFKFDLNPKYFPRKMKIISGSGDTFSIPHILEKVLSYTSTKALKNCRKVSSTWNSSGCLELTRRTSISIIYYPPFMQPYFKESRYGFLQFSPKKMQNGSWKSLSKLSKTMENTTLFPCTTFSLTTDLFPSIVPHNILSLIGQHVRNLHLSIKTPFKIDQEGKCAQFQTLTSELSRLVPQLKSLRICLVNTDATYLGPYKKVSRWHPKVQVAANLNFENVGVGALDTLTLENLKSLVIESPFPRETFLNLVNASPKLNSVSFAFSKKNGQGCTNGVGPLLGIFIEDVATLKNPLGINLLRHLSFVPNGHTIPVFERLLLIKGPEIQLKLKLKLQSLRIEYGFTLIFNLFLERIVAIVNQLLEISKDTLKELAIEPLGIMNGVRFPIMRKINKLKFLYYFSNHFGNNHLDTNYFPNGLIMEKIFPVLETVQVCTSLYTKKFFRKLVIADPLPVLGVKFVYLSQAGEVGENLKGKIKQKFPAAQVFSGSNNG